MRLLVGFLNQARCFVLDLLREIGDENAYHRHLAAHGTTHSAAEWRRFWDERWLNKSKRGRCC
jgi:hypothetical protein